MNLFVMMHVIESHASQCTGLVPFWCALILWWGSGASSHFYMGTGEELPMVMVTVWCALVLWWGSGAR